MQFVAPEGLFEDLVSRQVVEELLYSLGVFSLVGDLFSGEVAVQFLECEDSWVLAGEVNVDAGDGHAADLAFGASAVVGLHHRRENRIGPVVEGSERGQLHALHVRFADAGLAVDLPRLDRQLVAVIAGAQRSPALPGHQNIVA